MLDSRVSGAYLPCQATLTPAMAPSEPLPTCRRKALAALAGGAAFLGLAWLAHALAWG